MNETVNVSCTGSQSPVEDNTNFTYPCVKSLGDGLYVVDKFVGAEIVPVPFKRVHTPVETPPETLPFNGIEVTLLHKVISSPALTYTRLINDDM